MHTIDVSSESAGRTYEAEFSPGSSAEDVTFPQIFSYNKDQFKEEYLLINVHQGTTLI